MRYTCLCTYLPFFFFTSINKTILQNNTKINHIRADHDQWGQLQYLFLHCSSVTVNAIRRHSCTQTSLALERYCYFHKRTLKRHHKLNIDIAKILCISSTKPLSVLFGETSSLAYFFECFYFYTTTINDERRLQGNISNNNNKQIVFFFSFNNNTWLFWVSSVFMSLNTSLQPIPQISAFIRNVNLPSWSEHPETIFAYIIAHTKLQYFCITHIFLKLIKRLDEQCRLSYSMSAFQRM